MLKKAKRKPRTYIGSPYNEVLELPNLIDIQLNSYGNFLQAESLEKKASLKKQGLEEVFQDIFPIESSNGELAIEYDHYELDFNKILYDERTCKQKRMTYAVPLRAEFNLIIKATGEIRQKNIYMGDIPLMTERGTFIINGTERVVVSQIHRSPGGVFSYEKGVYSARIIPYRGAWVEFEIDAKNGLLYAKIDRKKRILATVLLRGFGLDTREKIIHEFYRTGKVTISEKKKEKLDGIILASPIKVEEEDGERILYKAGEKLHQHDIDELLRYRVKSLRVVDMEHEESIHSRIFFNCFEREESRLVSELSETGDMTKEEVFSHLYSILLPGEPITIEVAENDLNTMFFSPKRYNLGKVGRYKLNKKLGSDADIDTTPCLSLEDITKTMGHLIKTYEGEEVIDDIDHLGNRRVRSVGEMLTNTLKGAFSRVERSARERMALKSVEVLKIQDLIAIKPIVAAIKEFFGSSQLSQFMEQVNPLAELTHKRRLNALGPGGLSRDRAGFEVRDVHYTHYGRMCPIETPEGPNIGLIISLANYTRVNLYGFLETPYRKVVNGRATSEVEYLSAIDEEKSYIAQANAELDKDGKFVSKNVAVRCSGDYTIHSPDDIKYMDVSPKQIISTAASLIPFLEHDDANRALMGCNMQRQAVPLLFPEAPIVGTGMEGKAAYDSGVVLKAKNSGTVEYVSSSKIVLSVGKKKEQEVYELDKYQKTNQDTCFNQRPNVAVGDKVKKGDVLADGPATTEGELALGRNLLVGFVPWNGYNFEDAVLISRKVIQEERYSSVHIKEFSVEVRETKLGPERLTRDIPNVAEKTLSNLDEEGIIHVGAKVKSGSILVGKVTPKSETETTPEFKLLNSIFGEKAREVRDSSLRLPHGVDGIVVNIQRLKRSEGDDLSPGVDEMIKVYTISKRNLKEGDKMAGRHGNKGVVARILPEEDMPYLKDGTALDICLNPLGVPSRMNIGQIMETMLGMAGAKLGEMYQTPVFQSASDDQIGGKLEEAGLRRSSKMTVYDGYTGEPFENEILVGEMYYLKLHHLVDDKMHGRSTGPYSLVTQQPLGGKAQFGGQRLGEMEVWALEAYGAANTLQELMTIKSDDMIGRAKIYESVIKDENSSKPGIPESFNVLVQELKALALNLTICDAKGKPLPLTERDEEIINSQGSQF